MSKKDSLLGRLGSNMAESLGRAQDLGVIAGSVGVAMAPGQDATGVGKYEGRTRNRSLGDLDIEKIIADPNQPRKHFDQESLNRLAESIHQKGLLAPIRVRWDDVLGKWLVLCGERRYRAAKQAGLKSIPCVFVEADLSEEDILEEQLIENLHRENLNPIEEARAFAVLMKRNGWSGKDLAQKLRLTASAVTRTLAMLELPEDVQNKVALGLIAPRAAYELSKLDSAEDQQELAERVVADKLSKDETAKAVKEKRGWRPKGNRDDAGPQPPSTTVAYTLSRGSKVAVTIAKQPVSVDDVLAVLMEAVGVVKAELEARRPSKQEAA